MNVTIDHPASSYGIPVMLDDAGNLVEYPEGIRAARKLLGISTAELGALCGVSARTIEGWECGRTPSAAALNVISNLISNHKNKP